jgi:hypothetical protein
LRPAALEVHLAGPVIPDLHFIGSPSHHRESLPQSGTERRRCKRRSTLWAEEEKHYEEERSDLAQQMKPWAYSYFPSGGQGAASQEWTTRPPQLGLWACSYCREGSRDLVFHRGADTQTRSTCICHGDKCWE